MDNLVSILKSMEVETGTNAVSTQVTSVVEVADGTEHANSGRRSKRLQKSKGQKKIPSKKEANTMKPTAASASCPTKKPSFSTNKRIHVTPFPESETPMRPQKIMKPEEPKNKLNDDAEHGKDAMASDKPGCFSLSPFFWLREGEDEGGTAETLSDPLSLDTPLRHNAPCYSDIQDSDDKTPPIRTPNSKAAVPEVFDSEIFEWTQRPCSPELYSTPLKKQGSVKNIQDQIAENDDWEDLHLGGSFDKLGHASNAVPRVDAKEMKQKGKKARVRNSKSAKQPSRPKASMKEADANQQDSNCTRSLAGNSKNTKLPNRPMISIKETDVNQQDSNSTRILAAKLCEKNSIATKKNTSNRRYKAFSNINPLPCSYDNSLKTFLPEEDKETEAHDDGISTKRTQKKGKKGQHKCARKLGIIGNSTVEATESNPEPRSKRVRRMTDGGNAENIRVIAGSGSETEIPQLHSIIKGCTRNKPSDARREKRKLSGEMKSKIGLESLKQNIGGNGLNILPGKCQGSETTQAASSAISASVENTSAKGTEQSDCSGMKNFRKLQACNGRSTFLLKCDTVSKVSCAFCQSDDTTEESGEMVHYHNGKRVPEEFSAGANVTHAHKNCLEWAPNVYFEDDSVFNLTAELTRSKRIKCACCGIKGAALGCFDKSCRKSFHFTCAKLIPECRWDTENFVMLCPLHQSSKLPNESSGGQKQSKRIVTPKGPSQVRSSQDCSNNWKWASGPQKWVLCCSALSTAEKGIVSEFAKLTGVPISTSWSPSVTHVIASTDLSGACKRTLKFLMAILYGKWIVSMDWVKACMDRMEPVDEQKFEVTTDVHGISEGPRLGRQRVTNKQPKLFNGMQFYLHGNYTKSYRGYLQDLVVAAGGTILHRKPVSRDHQMLLDNRCPVVIVYSVENQEKAKLAADDHRRQADDAWALACASGGKVASSAWMIDSIAACSLQPLSLKALS